MNDWEQINEHLMVLLAQQGNRAAFCRLVDLYDKRLLYFIRRIVGETDEALDILQAVWLIVHRGLWKLKSQNAFRVWLYRIAHHQAVSELRRSSKRPVLIEEIETIQTPDATSVENEVFDNAELVHVALRDLSVDHRRVLTLRFLEDMTNDEIAEVVGCSPGTIKSRLHYAKHALRRRIKELLDD